MNCRFRSTMEINFNYTPAKSQHCCLWLQLSTILLPMTKIATFPFIKFHYKPLHAMSASCFMHSSHKRMEEVVANINLQHFIRSDIFVFYSNTYLIKCSRKFSTLGTVALGVYIFIWSVSICRIVGGRSCIKIKLFLCSNKSFKFLWSAIFSNKWIGYNRFFPFCFIPVLCFF